jgi:CheY-like chemotaxis protein
MDQKTILVVDNDINILNLVEQSLEQDNITVVKATKAEDALHLIRELDIDLVFMDIDMPGMDGTQAVQTLSNDPQTEHIPIIFLTGMITKDEEDAGQQELNIDGKIYPSLAKPFNHDQLVNAVRECIKD